MSAPAHPSPRVRRLLRTVAWLLLVGVIAMTLSPIGLRPHWGPPSIERATAFALLGAAFALAYPRHLPWVIAIVAGAAMLLEALQLLAPGRHGRLFDLSVKLGGGLAGVLLGSVVGRRLFGR